jgi:hypothetical protein
MLASGSPVCPICEGACRQAVALFGVAVCSRCARRFIHDRQAAYVLDCILFYSGMRILVWSAGLAGIANQLSLAPDWLTLAVLVFAGRMVFVCKDACKGRSPGKWLFHLLVIDEDSGAIAPPSQSIKRNLVLLAPLVGEIIGALSLRGGWRVGDRFAKTRVVPYRKRYAIPFGVRHDVCCDCGYALTGNVSNICPECGREFTYQELGTTKEELDVRAERTSEHQQSA